jgi:hypothetical protein
MDDAWLYRLSSIVYRHFTATLRSEYATSVLYCHRVAAGVRRVDGMAHATKPIY